MSTRAILCLGLIATVGLVALPHAAAQTPLGTDFSFQGQLNASGSPASGLHDLRFRLYDTDVGGAQVGPALCANDVSVTDGLFAVSLDFGAQFAGQKRFLEVEVRADTGLDCADLTGFVILAPRSALTAAPYALFAPNAATANNAVRLNGQSASFYQDASNLTAGTLPDGRLSGTYNGAVRLSNSGNAVTGTFGGDGSGLTAVNADRLDGLDSTAFLQANSIPLTLSGTSASHIFRADNASTALSATGVYGGVTGASGISYGVRGQNASTSGYGVLGWATAATGTTYGVYGQSNSATGVGVFGSAPASSSGIGVYGQSDGNSGRGVYGRATVTSGITYGVYGQCDSYNGAGVFGWASSTVSGVAGVSGQSDSDGGKGVYGNALAVSGETFGGYFLSQSTEGTGVFGIANAMTGRAYGVWGMSKGTTGRGVYGYAPASNGGTYGGYFVSESTEGCGVYGAASAFSGTIYGVLGQASLASAGYGVYSQGDMGASGVKPFRIDHPADPANKYLLHYATESPSPQNFYSGNIRTDAEGYAWVELPDYFETINSDYKYQLTVIDDADAEGFVLAKVSKEIRENRFQVRTSAPNAKVSWRVEANRNDPYVRFKKPRDVVEKQGVERGTYQHPELYGQPPEKGMNYDARRERPSPAPRVDAAPRRSIGP